MANLSKQLSRLPPTKNENLSLFLFPGKSKQTLPSGTEEVTTSPGATHSAMAVRGVGSWGKALAGQQVRTTKTAISSFDLNAKMQKRNVYHQSSYPFWKRRVCIRKASVGRQTPSSASKTKTVLNCLARVAPSSSQSCFKAVTLQKNARIFWSLCLVMLLPIHIGIWLTI